MTRQPRARGAPPRGGGRSIGRVAIAASLTSVALALLAVWTFAGPGPSAAKGEATDVVLPPGAGLPGIARALDQAHLIRSRAAFMAAAVITGGARHLKAGEYEFPSGAPLAQIISAIQRGAVLRHFITIPEGYTSREVVDVLRAAAFLAGPVQSPPEGSLLPETYEVRRGDSRMEVISRMAAARRDLLMQLWARRSPGLPYETSAQAVVLASVVEKETAKAEERPRIAAVFLNRLKKGMRLESDPTVIYAVSGGVPLGHGLRVSELASPSPYNTYRFAGLPPTPITNPGRAALTAALNPARTDDLFFVADGSGGHVFASTFEAHKRNVARWRNIEQHGGPSA